MKKKKNRKGKSNQPLNKGTKNLILYEVLGFCGDEVRKYEKLLKAANKAVEIDCTLPEYEKRLVDQIRKIFDWHSGFSEVTNKKTGEIKELPNFDFCHPDILVRELNRLTALDGTLAERRAYWRTRTSGLIINRRASKSAVSVALRQFGKSLEENIRKKLTVADCENFSEVLTAKKHSEELYAVYVSEYLNEISRGCKAVIHAIDQKLAELRHERKTEGKYNT